MAFGEDLIDFVSGLTAGAGRSAGTERRSELGSFCVLAPHPPAGETFGLAGKVIKRQLEGLEPASKAHGTCQAIGRRGNANGGGRARLPRDYLPIASEEMD